MNAAIAVLFVIAVVVIVRAFLYSIKKFKEIREAQRKYEVEQEMLRTEQAKLDAYIKEWSTWGDITKLKTGR